MILILNSISIYLYKNECHENNYLYISLKLGVITNDKFLSHITKIELDEIVANKVHNYISSKFYK